MYDHIPTFIAIVDAGNFIQAAKHLRVSQATVSRHLQSLEDELGVTLIIRNTKGFEVSRAGHKLYSEFKAQQSALFRTIDELRREDKLISGFLRVSLPVSMSYTMISPYLADFMHKNPGVELEICYQNREIDIVREKFDVAIVHYHPRQKTVLMRKIYTVQLGIYCSPKYIEVYGEPNTLEDIDKSHLCVGNIDYEENKNRVVVNQEPTQSLFTNRGRFLTNNSLHNKQIALSGHALVGGWDELFADELDSGKLIRIMNDYSFGEFSFYLMRVDGHKNAVLNVFIEFLDQCFAKKS